MTKAINELSTQFGKLNWINMNGIFSLIRQTNKLKHKCNMFNSLKINEENLYKLLIYNLNVS